MIWVIIAASSVLVNAISVVIYERRSREWQYIRFGEWVRHFDATMRLDHPDFTLTKAEFRPGWREGHGRIEWTSPRCNRPAYAEIPIRAPRLNMLGIAK